MLKHIIKSTFRNAAKNGLLSFTKLLGISLSFTIILLAVSYVRYETSFDSCFKDKDRIYRVIMNGKLQGREINMAVTCAPMARAARTEIPEIADAITIRPIGERLYTTNSKDFVSEKGLMVADTNFFSFFKIDIISSSNKPLGAKNNIVLSESLARKLFGLSRLALNKSVKIANNDQFDEYNVSGVFKDLPDNCHMKCSAVINLQNTNYNNNWSSQNIYTYVKTKSALVTQKQLDFKLTQLVYLHTPGVEKDPKKAKQIEDFKWKSDSYLLYYTEKLSDIHLSEHKFDSAITSNKTYVYGAMVLALLVLLISAFNYVNLTIANLMLRVKEFGIRKSNGASTSNIMFQFFFDSFIFWLVGFVLSFTMFYFFRNSINNYLGFDTKLKMDEIVRISIYCFLGLIVFNVLINTLPIVAFARKNVSSISKIGSGNESSKGAGRNVFLIIQFFISVVVILSTLLVYKQIKYTSAKYLGYNSENVLVLNLSSISQSKTQIIFDKLSESINVEHIAFCDNNFGKKDPKTSGVNFEKTSGDTYLYASIIGISPDFAQTLNMKMACGRFFDKKRETDKNAVIINESAAREYLQKGALIGKTLIYCEKSLEIIGIIKDFNFRPIYYPIEPLVLVNGDRKDCVYLKVAPNRLAALKKEIDLTCKELSLSKSPELILMDDILAQNYTKDRKAMKLLLLISLISIFISGFGLYAIVYFTINRKVKEIGIRRVNGARTIEIITLVNIDFLKWILLSILLACPVAWYLMSKWLQNFAYRTELSWWIFPLAGGLAMGIALITISWQSWRAARRNPVESLRYE